MLGTRVGIPAIQQAPMWTPAQRGADLIAWLEAEASSVTLASGVAAWAALSGTNKGFSQASAPSRLGYSASDPAYGGRGVLLGNNVGYLLGDANWAESQPITLYFVGSLGDSVDWKTAWDGSTSAADRLTLRADPTEQGSIYAGAANVTGTTLANAPSIVCAIYDGAGSSLRISSTTAAVTGNPGTQGIAIPLVGRAAIDGVGYVLPTGGKIHAFAITRVADSAAQRAQMMSYFSRRTNLAVAGL